MFKSFDPFLLMRTASCANCCNSTLSRQDARFAARAAFTLAPLTGAKAATCEREGAGRADAHHVSGYV